MVSSVSVVRDLIARSSSSPVGQVPITWPVLLAALSIEILGHSRVPVTTMAALHYRHTSKYIKIL